MSQSAARLSFKSKMLLKRLNGRILRPVAFRPHLTMGLVLYRKDLGSQQANYAYQEQDMYILRWFFMTNLLDRGWRIGRNIYMRIPTLYVRSKSGSCQEKNGFSSISLVRRVLVLEKVGISRYLSVSSGKEYVQYLDRGQTYWQSKKCVINWRWGIGSTWYSHLILQRFISFRGLQ